MWEWIYPSLIVFGSAVVVALVVALIVRAVRRGPRARTRAEAVRDRAGAALTALDDAIGAADVELGLAAAVYGGKPPAALTRARLSAVQVRDEGFVRYRTLVDDSLPAPALRSAAQQVITRSAAAQRALDTAHAGHRAWLRENADAPKHIASARSRAAAVAADLGEPGAREQRLSRLDPSESADVAAAATAAHTALRTANAALDRAEALASDPSSSILEDLTEAEAALRTAEHEAAEADRAYEQVETSARVVTAEIAAVRERVRTGMAALSERPDATPEAVSGVLSAALVALDDAEQHAARRPSATLTELTRVRDRVELALSDARAGRARIDGAKAALPGAFATARLLIGRAERAVAASPAPDARIRLAAARDELAAARNASDAIEALDVARRAIRHAEDAAALAGYAGR
ncbi:hypothetical protein [Microbacterium gorillae]|uniref:hypothetical protein n=1 Tax=Microbacterium gorillae TaxID=1231063 RepID=UPI00058D7A2B|nr:hypothetical protein [Microbacterium gorillae]